MSAYKNIMAWILRRYGLTGFEMKVLCETMNIRAGDTVTYSELAQNIGKPRASRAVGNALNKNPLPLLIPCHRVVAGNGIGGYHYGTAAKKALLTLERMLTNPISA